jgi:hypothetical protein
MHAWALFNNYNTYQMLLCQRYCIYNTKNLRINHVKFYAENFRRSGHGGVSTPTNPPVNTPLHVGARRVH